MTVAIGKVPRWLKELRGWKVPYWCDHYGTVTEDDREVFVSEPYSISADDLDEFLSLVKAIGARAEISGTSEHNPGSTFRISIYPPRHRDPLAYSEQSAFSTRNLPHNFVIYGLFDPRDSLCRYVGQSLNVDKRFRQHLKDFVNREKYTWIRELREHGMQPHVEILDSACAVTVRTKEKHWIIKLRSEGHPLTTREYGRAINTPREHWFSLSSSLMEIRDLLFRAVNEAATRVGGSHKASRKLDDARKCVDSARCALDSELCQKFPDWEDADKVFYGDA